MGEGLKIGHPLIDGQHEEILKAIFDLKDELSGIPPADCAERLRTLLQMMEQHFTTEEKLLHELNYGSSRIETHSERHRNAVAMLRSLIEDCTVPERCTPALAEELLRLFFDDLIAADMEIKTHLQKVGFKPE